MKKIIKNLIPPSLREKLQILKGKKIYIDNFDKTKSIFVHIPKCAGTSIGKAIYNDEKISHSTANDYNYTNNLKFIEYYKFTIVRDPKERCYSAYNFLKSDKCSITDKSFFNQHISKFKNFDDFVKNGLSKIHVQNYVLFKPQVEFFSYKGVIKVNQIFVLNNLQHDYLFLKKKFKIKSKLKRLNHTKNFKKKRIKTSNSNLINKIYKDDYLILKILKKKNYLLDFYGLKIKDFKNNKIKKRIMIEISSRN